MRENQHTSSVLARPGVAGNRHFGPQAMRNGMAPDMQRAMASKQMYRAFIYPVTWRS